jgi:hypothetical protein
VTSTREERPISKFSSHWGIVIKKTVEKKNVSGDAGSSSLLQTANSKMMIFQLELL